ncbi:MAG: glucosaminidase domain-containing protein [Chitinophagaceae bacterium]
MKKIFLLVVTTIIFLSIYAQNTAIQNYISTYKELAINEMMRTGVPASITLAQGILESQAGQSDLVKQSNNHFGIKCKTEWTGAKIYHDDDEKGECFRVYQSAEDSYRDHSDFLKNRPYYADLFNLDPTDYQGWAYGLKQAGYATEKDYPQNLIKLITDYHLQDYTLIALQKERNPNQQIIAANNSLDNSTSSANNNNVFLSAPTQQQNISSVTIAQTSVAPPSYPKGIFSINQLKVIYAQAGTSLFALASNYNVAYQKLLDFNELPQQDILAKDQLIFLERKSKKGANDFHVVAEDETLENIAQTEGVRLENLLEYNHLYKGEEPAKGEKIYLKFNAPYLPKLAGENIKLSATSGTK